MYKSYGRACTVHDCYRLVREFIRIASGCMWVWDTETIMNGMDGVWESEHGFGDGIEYKQVVMIS